MKITVVGAGNVGATCADVLAHRDAAHEIVLVDIKPGIAEGKALDIWQSAPIDRFNSQTDRSYQQLSSHCQFKCGCDYIRPAPKTRYES